MDWIIQKFSWSLVCGCSRRTMTLTIFALFFLEGSIVSTHAGRFVAINNPAPNPIGSGAPSLGMGNASIAVADKATAASWNPAGLTQLELPEFSFALETIRFSEKNSSNTNPEVETKQDFSLEDFNFASVVYPFYFMTNMVISLNYLKLYRFEKELAFPFATELTGLGSLEMNHEFVQKGDFSVLAPAFALDVTDHLSLGLTINIWNDSITRSSNYRIRQRSAGTIDNLEYREFEQDSFEVEEGYSFVLGALYHINPYWDLGFVVKPQFTLDLNHEFEGDVILGSFTGASALDINAELTFPMIIGVGASWRPSDQLTLSLDATWTDWSRYTLKESEEEVNPATGRSEDEFDDTFTLRFGIEYVVMSDHYLIPFRWGIGYDPSPAVNKVDDFYTISAGTGVQIGAYNLDLSYEFRFGNNVHKDLLRGIGAKQNVRRHRILASLIYYF